MNAQIAGLNASFLSWQQIAERRYVELSERDLTLAKRVNEDEQHIYINDQRIVEIYRRLEALEKKP